ncbi:MAG: polysaccharide biosynthesis protein [Magnetococcales bacterium]|nr:polysaccharide biosynthesis protein [Magnetococcales bacterium]
MTPSILRRILGREESLFQADMEAQADRIVGRLRGARMLVIGAAGSIGAAFVRVAARYPLGGLRLVDPSENNLVELVRELRAADVRLPDDFATSAISLGSLEFEHFWAAQKPFDLVVNFAALKHVRAERDPFTLMRMLHVNILALDELLAVLAVRPPGRFFSVSSDKAVNPVNLMGASKALMERVMWYWSGDVPTVSSRFANVAFSDGSLLHGFVRRLEKRQPLAAPLDVRRYFISHEEAGQLCLLALASGGNREIYLPKLDKGGDLVTFARIAEIFLEEHGYRPRCFESDEEARLFAAAMVPGCREWPCRFSVSDTSGEKEEEEFHAAGEEVDWGRFARVGVVTRASGGEDGALAGFLVRMRQMREAPRWEMGEMIHALRQAVPTLAHLATGRDLDGKM